MADLKISEWEPADDLTGDEILPLVQGGQNRRSTVGAATASAGGLPAGGTTGQILAKASNTNYDTEWVAPADGSSRNLVQMVSSVSGVLTIDCNYDYHYISLTENVTSITFTNLPGTDRGVTLMLFIYQDSTPRTVAWPPSFAFTSGSETEVATGSGDESVLAISTPNGGLTWVATMQYGGA